MAQKGRDNTRILSHCCVKIQFISQKNINIAGYQSVLLIICNYFYIFVDRIWQISKSKAKSKSKIIHRRLNMASDKITISDIINIKGGTIDELCLYAQQKGVEIPNDPDYVLSPSQLNSLDPKLAWDIKYGKIVSQKSCETDEESEVKVEIIPPKVFRLDSENRQAPTPKVLGKIDLENIDLSSLPKLKTKKTSPSTKAKNEGNDDVEQKNSEPQRVIGIVKFFDSFKGWGFFVTSGKGIRRNLEEGCLISLHITSSEWKSSSDPRDNEWVVFTPRSNSRGWSAIDAKRLEYSRDDLLVAMKYRGKYARINGTDNKGDSFDENVLCHIIRRMTVKRRDGITRYSAPTPSYDEEKFQEVIDCFCDFVSQKPEHKRESLIKEFLEDVSLNKLLFTVFTEGEYTTEDETKKAIYSQFKDIIVNQLFETDKLEDLSALPSTFDYTPYVDKLAAILVNEAKHNSAAVERWISENNIINAIRLQNTDVDTIPLRLILQEKSGNTAWLDDLTVDWTAMKEFIKDNHSYGYRYCKIFFVDKDEEFVRNHSLADVLDEATASIWCGNLMKEEVVPLVFLRSLMEQTVVDTLELWSEYVKKGFDVSPSYSTLRKVLFNELTNKNIEGVRSFFNTCSEHEIEINNIFDNIENVSDEIKAELFFLTVSKYFYDSLAEKSIIIERMNKSGVLEINKFLKFCSHNFSDEELSNAIDSLNNEKLISTLKRMGRLNQCFLRSIPLEGHFNL